MKTARGGTRRRTPSRRGQDPHRNLRHVLDGVPFPAWMCDAEGRMTYLNAPFRSAVGGNGASTPADLWDSSIKANERELWSRIIRSASAVGEAFRVELQADTADGRHRRYQFRGIPAGAQGRTQGYWGTAVDISAGQWHMEAARGAEERYRALAGFFDRPAIGLDLDLSVRAWNAAAVARTGIPETTAIGRTLADLPPPFGGESVRAACRQALREHAVRTLLVRGLDGERQLRIHPYRSGLLLTEDSGVIPSEPAPGPGRPYTGELLHTVLQSTSDIIVIQDPQAVYVYFNAPAGLGIAMEDVAGRKPGEIFPVELADRIVSRVHAVCASGQPMVDRSTIDWRGSRRWFQEHLSPVFDAAGQVTAVVTIARDITEQRQAELRLRESEARYRSFVEHSQDGIWKLVARETIRTDAPADEQVRRLLHGLVVEECNDAAARVHGHARREDLIGSALAVHLSGDPSGRDRLLRSFVENDYRLESGEMKTVDRSGQSRYLLHTLVGTVMDGVLKTVWGNIAEVTQRRLADREMRLLAQTITCAQDCVSITDLRDTILFVNDAFLRTYGYADQEELTGKNVSVVREGDGPMGAGMSIREKTLAGGWNGELINRRKDGSTFPVELWTSVVKGEDGAPVAMVGVARDITERRKAEEQIRTSLHEKEIMLKEIHHRVKNNLQIVSSLLSLQSEYIVDPEMLRFFRESQNRVKSMALVHEKLYQSTNLASVDFDGYLRELATHLLRSSAAETGRMEVRLATRGVLLPVDRAIPCGIIVNELVTNALKYAFPGERKGTLYVECTMEGPQQVLLVVGDDGVGLPPGLEVEHAETLGLTLVEMLCDQLQAQVVVHRQAKRLGAPTGVEFEIRFAAGNGYGHPEKRDG